MLPPSSAFQSADYLLITIFVGPTNKNPIFVSKDGVLYFALTGKKATFLYRLRQTCQNLLAP
jgi:hypothetical protein